MTTICTMTGQQYRAAFACKANGDVRYYLNGLFLSAEHGEIVATDGSMLFVCSIEFDEHKAGVPFDLIFEPAKIPAGILDVTISVVDQNSVMVSTVDKRGGPGPQSVCPVIDGTYPDYRAIFDKKHEDTEFHKIGWSAQYLAVLKTIFGSKPLRFEIPNATSPAVISDFTAFRNGRVILIPRRI